MADHETIAKIKDLIQDVLDRMSIQARVEYEDSLANGLVFNIYSRDAKLLIGHQGATLYALEHILHAVVARKFNSQTEDSVERILFSIDVDEYKRNRQFQLKQIVKDAISDIKRSGTSISLQSMSKYERRFIHTYIQEQFPHIKTESLGVDPRRYIKLSLETI